MAAELPDVLEKLSMKAERSEGGSSASLSKYFGGADHGDDIFDAIAKPRLPTEEEPKVNFFKSPASTPVKEELSRTSSLTKTPPTFAFKKGDNEEPKIFSYFSQPEASMDGSGEATEFFDQISELTSKTHEPLEISSHLPADQPGVPQTPSPRSPYDSLHEPGVPKPADLPLPVTSHYTPRIASASPPVPVVLNDPSEANWSKAQERASSWWIPNDKTGRWLSNPSSAVVIQAADLTSPSLSSNVELTDPIKQLLRHFDGDAAAAGRETLTADLVTQDDRGIRDLVKVGCWRAAANLCGRLLTAYGQGFGKAGQPSKHTPHTLQLWFTRIAMLQKARLTEMAYNEAQAFGDLDGPDLYFEFYPELGKRGTMVPFSFRLLAAQLPAYYNGQINRAQSRLCQLLATVRRILAEIDRFAESEGMTSPEERREAAELWSKREAGIVMTLVNCALMKKDFHNAVQLLRKQLEHSSGSPALYSALGRIYLQLGDVQRAQKAFNSAADLRNKGASTEAVGSLLDAGLIAVAQNAFSEAHGYFKRALLIQPDNPVLVNNTAACLLYMGSMRDSMLMLEENLGTKPDAMIRDDTVLNVCTLHELESSLTSQRKLGMLRLASQWRNDNLNVNSFKLQP